MEQREKTRANLLNRALELFPNREARPVWSWPERDKHSAVWLLCLPGPDTSFSAAEFGEACAAMLCLPSPACAPRLGEPVKGLVKVCQYGDTVVNQTMRGDGWRTRHNAMLLRLRKLLRWAGIPVVCEVFNIFASCIPQDDLSRIERGRKRQGLVPDCKLPPEHGAGTGGERGGQATLCKLKCMSASSSRYPRNPRPRDRVRAVDRRAEGLTAKYTAKAQKVDWAYCGTPRPLPRVDGARPEVRVIGPVEAKLLTFGQISGWCFGACGEASSDIHSLVQRISRSRQEVVDLQHGRRGAPKSRVAELASHVGYVRRQLAHLAVQQQSRLLLDRLELLGDGSAEAAKRRDWAVQAERAVDRERRAQAVCQRQGRALFRSGFAKLD